MARSARSGVWNMTWTRRSRPFPVAVSTTPIGLRRCSRAAGGRCLREAGSGPLKSFGFLSLRKNWLCFAKITLMFSLPGNGDGVAPIFILGGEFLALMPVLFRVFVRRRTQLAGMLADDIDRSSALQSSIAASGARSQGWQDEGLAHTASICF